MDIVAFILAYRYLFLFIGMFIAGETVLLPAIYLSLQGSISVAGVVIVSLLSTLLSDFVWYFLGYYIPLYKIRKWKRVERHQDLFNKLTETFNNHAYGILFVSKFVYGTRILVQIICGIHRLRFGRYILVNTIGVLAYLGLLYLLAITFGSLVADTFFRNIKFALTLFVLLVILINLWIRHIVLKKISQ